MKIKEEIRGSIKNTAINNIIRILASDYSEAHRARIAKDLSRLSYTTLVWLEERTIQPIIPKVRTQEEIRAKARELLIQHNPNWITAIKELRNQYSIGLKEAKELVDELRYYGEWDDRLYKVRD